jgi:hypothetical protein
MPPHATDERAAADDARPVLGRFYLMIVVNLVSTSDLINTSLPPRAGRVARLGRRNGTARVSRTHTARRHARGVRRRRRRARRRRRRRRASSSSDGALIRTTLPPPT